MNTYNPGNRPIDIGDFESNPFRTILDDMHTFIKAPKRKRNSAERCRGRSILEPAVFESYKHWDNPWAILNASMESGMRVLDCGSGRGILQFYLAGKGFEVHAIDIRSNRSKTVYKIHDMFKKIGFNYKINPQAVHKKLNRKYRVNVCFRQESADSLSYEDNYFDRVFSISVIEHMDDEIIAGTMKEIERVLKPGGLLLLTFDFHPEPDKNIIGFTGDDFYRKVLDKCGLEIANNRPDFSFQGWNDYIKEVNRHFRTVNPNTSYGVVLSKPE